jgi:ribonuclease J
MDNSQKENTQQNIQESAFKIQEENVRDSGVASLPRMTGDSRLRGNDVSGHGNDIGKVQNDNMNNALIYISLGGLGEVTKNLHVYQFGNEILLVDCGLGFANETMLGVDLLIPDISYLEEQLQKGKRIIGMVITHGHEDHMGALPLILPQLPQFPIYATKFTSALANEKLQEFKLKPSVKDVPFGQQVRIGSFAATFIPVTHSVPDTANILIQTPVGNFYHGSDFKFDLTPSDGRKTDFQAIVRAGMIGNGIRCLLSECLGAERVGYTRSDFGLANSFEEEMRKCTGKFIVTTYSSNIARLNQIINVGQKLNKYFCFVGRSLIKAKEIAAREGLLNLKKEREISMDQVKRHNAKDVLLFVAGSQGQENSALSRMVHGEHRDIQVKQNDVVVFSADPIPGNEISINIVIDELSRLGIKVLYSGVSDNFHVSGHGSSQELLLLMSLLSPKQVLPISGSYKHMLAYKQLAKRFGFADKDILMLEEGQEMIFTKDKAFVGQKHPIRHVYVDQMSGEEIDQFVIHDRQKISQEGIVAVIAEIDSEDGSLVNSPQIVARGFGPKETQDIQNLVIPVLKKTFVPQKRIVDWLHIRKRMKDVVEKTIADKLKRRPLVLPVAIEV